MTGSAQRIQQLLKENEELKAEVKKLKKAAKPLEVSVPSPTRIETVDPVLIIAFPECAIHVFHNHLCATYYVKVGNFMTEKKMEKHWPHTQDMFSLNVRGIVQLAAEFKAEVISTLTN